MSGSSNALSRILLNTEVYPLQSDLAFSSAWGDNRRVTICYSLKLQEFCFRKFGVFGFWMLSFCS